MKTVNIALIGSGFIGRAHANALRSIGLFFPLPVTLKLHTLCDIVPDLPALREQYGFEYAESDWRKVVDDPQIDAVVIATPGFTHAEIACQAAERGKHILCEKPMTIDCAQAEKMERAVSGRDIVAMMDFTYRFIPAVRELKKLIAQNALGRIYHFGGFYLQDWAIDEQMPYVWRMSAEKVGYGPLEVGSHIIDLARYLVGEITQVSGLVKTFIDERRDRDGVSHPVTTDDLSVFTARFESGAVGLFEAGRVLKGHKNEMSFEINGSKGSARFNLGRINELELCLDQDPAWSGFKTVSITEAAHEYMGNWWASGHVIGWENLFVHMYYEFLRRIAGQDADIPTFKDGAAAHRIVDAVVRSSDQNECVLL